MSRFRPATRSSFILQDAAGDNCNVRAESAITTTSSKMCVPAAVAGGWSAALDMVLKWILEAPNEEAPLWLLQCLPVLVLRMNRGGQQGGRPRGDPAVPRRLSLCNLFLTKKHWKGSWNGTVKWPNSVTRQHSLPNLLDGNVGPQHRRLVHVPEAAVAHLVPLALRGELRRVELRPIHHPTRLRFLNLAATTAATATATGATSVRSGRNTAPKRGPGSARCYTADGVRFGGGKSKKIRSEGAV
jgi:hypothetical protein